MTLQNHKSHIEIGCDGKGCSEVEEGSDFQELWSELKEAGWKAEQSGRKGGWQHFCPGCQSDDLPLLTKGLK